MKKIIYTFFVFSILLSSCVQDVDLSLIHI